MKHTAKRTDPGIITKGNSYELKSLMATNGEIYFFFISDSDEPEVRSRPYVEHNFEPAPRA